MTLALGACGGAESGSGNRAGTTSGQGGAGGSSGSGGSAAGQNNTAGKGGGGGATSAGTPAGGSPSSGTQNGGGDGAGASTGGAAGAGGAPNGECTRALLDGLLDDYFAALSAGDPSTLPLAADLKFTENAEVGQIGMTLLWMNAGDTKYSQRALF